MKNTISGDKITSKRKKQGVTLNGRTKEKTNKKLAEIY